MFKREHSSSRKMHQTSSSKTKVKIWSLNRLPKTLKRPRMLLNSRIKQAMLQPPQMHQRLLLFKLIKMKQKLRPKTFQQRFRQIRQRVRRVIWHKTCKWKSMFQLFSWISIIWHKPCKWKSMFQPSSWISIIWHKPCKWKSMFQLSSWIRIPIRLLRKQLFQHLQFRSNLIPHLMLLSR